MDIHVREPAPQAKNEVGNKYGQLTVVEYVSSNTIGLAIWKCLCMCGKYTIVRGDLLRSGRTKSCGCITTELRLEKIERASPGRSGFNQLYAAYRVRAKRLERTFELTKDEFKTVVVQNCIYCGSSPSNVYKGHNDDYVYNGIDRVDSSSGYALNNVVPCCKRCNLAKRDMTQDEFLSWAKRLALHQDWLEEVE